MIPPFRVVAHRAQDDDAGVVPVDGGIVPHGHAGLDVALAQGVGQGAVVVVEV